MAAQLDHLVVPVNSLPDSLVFYTRIMGFTHEGADPPFEVVRVSADLTLQMAARRTQGGMHMAFAMSPDEFDAVFTRVREAGLEYGASFDSVGRMDGPGYENGARGFGKAVYMFDPDKHLIEIRCY